MDIGYFLSSEEYGPADLIEQAERAEAAGMTEAWISDHYHPWLEVQGHSPFVWTVLGAIAHTTDLTLTTGVTCPTMRIHPAIVAQAAATTAVLSGGRFRLGVGSGEKLNEHILGDAWPDTDRRLDMLEESIEVMRMLWEGGTHSYAGRFYEVRNARLYDLPDEPPPVIVSAFGSKSAELAGRVGDGLASTRPSSSVVRDFESAGGEGLKLAGMKVCFDRDEEAARALAHRTWAQSALPGELAQELPMPAHFEQASTLVTEGQVAEQIPCGADPEAFAEAIDAYARVGFDVLFIQQIGPDQGGFLHFLEDEIRPVLQVA